MRIIAGSSNLRLAEQIARQANLRLVQCQLTQFTNGEKRVWINEDVNGENVTIIQSFNHPVDQNIIETLLIIDALERMGARHINLILPWFGYSLQDKVFRNGEPIAAKVIADILSSSRLSRVFLLDLHNSSIAGFFSTPTEHLTALELFTQYTRKHYDLANLIVASPDFGGLKRARLFATNLGVSLVNIDKHRDLTTGQVTANQLVGDVTGKTVLLYDDVIVSGSTVIKTAELLKRNQAKTIVFMSTHGLFTNKAQEKLLHSEVDEIVITNSIDHATTIAKITTLSLGKLFADALRKWI